jgi:hypothetical protein
MSRILVKAEPPLSNKILIRKEIAVQQIVGGGKKPTFGQFARNTFAQRGQGVTGRQRLRGLVGMGGKVAAAAVTAQQSAEALQGGNLGAPLQAGVTYQGMDPTATLDTNVGEKINPNAKPIFSGKEPVAVQAPAPVPNNQAPKVGVQAPVMPPAHQQQYTPEGNPIPKPDNTGGGRYNTNVAVTTPTQAAPTPTPAPAPVPAAPAPNVMTDFAAKQQKRYNLNSSDPRYLAPGQTTAAMQFAQNQPTTPQAAPAPAPTPAPNALGMDPMAMVPPQQVSTATPPNMPQQQVQQPNIPLPGQEQPASTVNPLPAGSAPPGRGGNNWGGNPYGWQAQQAPAQQTPSQYSLADAQAAFAPQMPTEQAQSVLGGMPPQGVAGSAYQMTEGGTPNIEEIQRQGMSNQFKPLESWDKVQTSLFTGAIYDKLGPDMVYKMTPHQIGTLSAYMYLKLS